MTKRKEKLFVHMLIGIIILQPLLDLVWLNNGTIGEVFGFSIPTIVRMGGVALLGVFSFLVFKFNKKHWLLVGYLAMIATYFIMHHVHALSFQSLVPGNFNYSMVGEAFYVIRMCIPLAMMYFVYNSQFGDKQMKQSVLGVVIIISSIEIITNIFKVAICSYSDNKIDGSIFDWFLNQGAYYYNQLASKGWFYVSIVSMTLVLLLPYVLYLFIDTKKKRYLILCIAQAISLFMFGTKATSYSVIIVSIIMLVLYLFIVLVKKDCRLDMKIFVALIVILVGSIGITPYSPAVSREQFDEEYESEIDEEEEASKEYNFESREEIVEFFEQNYKFLSINETILVEKYSYEADPYFWIEFCDETVPSQRMQNRFVQEAVLKRVQEINANENDKYLGIGYTRTSNIYNLEKDFVYQYYSMGLLGALLLVGPYVILLLIIMIAMLVNFRKKVTLLNCSLVLGCGLTCCLAYYSGNTLENLGVSIVLGAVYGYLLKSVFRKEL